MSKSPALRRSAKLLRNYASAMPVLGLLFGAAIGMNVGATIAYLLPGLEINLPKLFRTTRELALIAGGAGALFGLVAGTATRVTMRGIAVALLALAEQAVPSQPRE